MRIRWTVVAAVAIGWAALAGAVSVRGLPPRELRTWTSVSGATVEARLVFNYGVWAQLEEGDGVRLRVRCAHLCEADKEYLRGFGSTRLSFWQRARATRPELIDINSCSQAQLRMLPRIGETLARRIIQGRPYRKPRNLLDIEGIGAKTYDGIRHDITAKPVKREPEAAVAGGR